jgi:hypothetical protein
METKDQLIKSIQEWVKNDNEIRKLKSEIATRQINQKRISKELIDIMRTNEIDEFDISNGKIKYSKRNVRKPISKKGLLGILSKYCNGDINKATEINNFIVENREETTVETIIRKIK